MPKFRYEAMDDNGKTQRGTVDADTEELALKQLRSIGLYPTNIKLSGSRLSRSEKAARGKKSTKQKEETITLATRIAKARQARGIKPERIEELALGSEKQASVRELINEYQQTNPQLFDESTEEGAAATELYAQAKKLTREAMRANRAQAKRIYEKLLFILDVVKNSQGENAPVTMRLEQIIQPVRDAIKQKSTFSAMVKDRARTFAKSLPEKIASEIPIIGGILGDYFKERREGKEELERYTMDVRENIADRQAMKQFPQEKMRKGSGRGRGSIFDGEEGGGSKLKRTLEMAGATPVENLFGDMGSKDPKKNPLGAVYAEAVKIRKILEREYGAEEEAEKKEQELEKKQEKQRSLSQKFKDLWAKITGQKQEGEAGKETGAGDKGGKGLSPYMSKASKWLGRMGGSLFAGTLSPGTAVASAGLGATALYAGAGLAIGTGVAYGINKGIDKLTGAREGEGLADYMMRGSTWKSLIMPGGLALDGVGLANDLAYAATAKTEITGKAKEKADTYQKAMKDYDSKLAEKGVVYDYTSGEYRSMVTGEIIKDTSTMNLPTMPSILQKTDGKIVEAGPGTTSAAQMSSRLTAEQDATDAARAAAKTPAAPTTNNTSVANNTSVVNNNFNDDLRVRNNEPTVRQMQRGSVM